MPFTVPSYDELLNAILTDYINQLPGADTSKGSMIYIKSAAIASALWGLYQHQRYVLDQTFPDTADTASLEHHAWVYGISRIAGENDQELLTRLLAAIRQPPAGGNKNDYEQWALSIDSVAAATCIPLAQGDGTVDVIIQADIELTGSEIPDQTLLEAVTEYIDLVRPVTHSQVRILPPTVVSTNVTMVATGSNINLAAITTEITALMAALSPGETLYRAQLVSAAISHGAVNAVISAPVADVEPASAAHMIRPGVINVT